MEFTPPKQAIALRIFRKISETGFPERGCLHYCHQKWKKVLHSPDYLDSSGLYLPLHIMCLPTLSLTIFSLGITSHASITFITHITNLVHQLLLANWPLTGEVRQLSNSDLLAINKLINTVESHENRNMWVSPQSSHWRGSPIKNTVTPLLFKVTEPGFLKFSRPACFSVSS